MSKPRSRQRRSTVPQERPAARPEWQLQDAKARFSELFRLAREQGPQRVTKHGREAVVVIPAEEYARISRPPGDSGSLARFFAMSPLRGSGIRLGRPRDFGRVIDL